VRDHALAHYNDGGWDVVVETMEVDEMVAWITRDAPELLGREALTLADVIAVFETPVAVWADRQADARNSVF
jgi:hypothetical protein